MEMSLRVRTLWTGKICLALPKFSTKFFSAKFSICQVWVHLVSSAAVIRVVREKFVENFGRAHNA